MHGPTNIKFKFVPMHALKEHGKMDA